MVISCSQNMLLENKAVQAFQDSRDTFAQAVTMFRSERLEIVMHGGVNALVYAQRYGAESREAMSGDFAERLRSVLDEAGLTRIADDRGNGNLTLVPSGTAFGSKPRYYIEYVYGETQPEAPDCHKNRQRGESGQCVIPLKLTGGLITLGGDDNQTDKPVCGELVVTLQLAYGMVPTKLDQAFVEQTEKKNLGLWVFG